LNDFEALVRKIDVPALVLQNHPKSIRTSVRTSISRTSASKWPATAYTVAKSHFEGGEFKKNILVFSVLYLIKNSHFLNIL
jgi:hypothetical protein